MDELQEMREQMAALKEKLNKQEIINEKNLRKLMQIFMAIYYYLSNRMFSMMEFHTQGFRIAIIFPIVALILDYLALRAIFKDETLVRSLDRIR